MSKKKDEKPANQAGVLTADNDVNAEIVSGQPRADIKPVEVQAREARGEDEAAADDGGAADTKAATINYTDAEKAKDAAVDARHAYMEKVTGDPDAAAKPGGGAGDIKVESADKNEKFYTGVVTVTGVDEQYGKKISTRIDVGPAPKGHNWLLHHAFKHHFPSADVSKGITVDEKNESDPLLRTQHG